MTTSEEIAERRAIFKASDAINASEGTFPDKIELEIRKRYILGKITQEVFVALKNERFSKMERIAQIQ